MLKFDKEKSRDVAISTGSCTICNRTYYEYFMFFTHAVLEFVIIKQ